jgi:hypothetical protein
MYEMWSSSVKQDIVDVVDHSHSGKIVCGIDPGIKDIFLSFIASVGTFISGAEVLEGRRPRDGCRVVKLSQGEFYSGIEASLATSRDARPAEGAVADKLQAVKDIIVTNAAEAIAAARARAAVCKDPATTAWCTRPDRVKARFARIRAKHIAIDKFCKRLVAAKVDVVVYGSAGLTMKGSYRRNRAVPTAGAYARLVRYFHSCGKAVQVIVGDEFNTSKLCHRCGARLHAVKRKAHKMAGWAEQKPGAYNDRSLVFCGVCQKLYGRDENAAINLTRVGAFAVYHKKGKKGMPAPGSEASATATPPRPAHLRYDREGSGFREPKVVTALQSRATVISSAVVAMSKAESALNKCAEGDPERPSREARRHVAVAKVQSLKARRRHELGENAKKLLTALPGTMANEITGATSNFASASGTERTLAEVACTKADLAGKLCEDPKKKNRGRTAPGSQTSLPGAIKGASDAIEAAIAAADKSALALAALHALKKKYAKKEDTEKEGAKKEGAKKEDAKKEDAKKEGAKKVGAKKEDAKKVGAQKRGAEKLPEPQRKNAKRQDH